LRSNSRLVRLTLLIFFAVDVAARFALQDGLAFRAKDLHVRLIGGDVSFAPTGMEGLPAGLARQGQFTEAAFHSRIVASFAASRRRASPHRRCDAHLRLAAKRSGNYLAGTTAMEPVSEI